MSQIRLWIASIVLVSMLACSGGPFRSGSTQYIVKKGDTLYSIAWQMGQDFRTLASFNGVREPYTIYPGQVIRLPSKSQVVVSNTKKSQPQIAVQPSTVSGAKSLIPTVTAKSEEVEIDVSKSSGRRSGKWYWPAKGRVVKHFSPVSSGFKGIDILGKLGDPIKAVSAGRVVYSGQGLLGYGNLIIIKHSDDYLSAYAHNQKLFAKEGDNVRAGQMIAQMGNTGANRVKLYFEMRYAGKPINPLKLLSNPI